MKLILVQAGGKASNFHVDMTAGILSECALNGQFARGTSRREGTGTHKTGSIFRFEDALAANESSAVVEKLAAAAHGQSPAFGEERFADQDVVAAVIIALATNLQLVECFIIVYKVTLMGRRMILFTSLPEVGGHSALTYGLCRMLRPQFSELEVWCRPMAGHGHSVAVAAQLEELGCSVRLLAEPGGRRDYGAIFSALKSARRAGPPDVFFSLAMRHFSVVFALLLGARNAIYYHITHDLNPGTIRRLRVYARFFQRMVFICPATYEEFPGAGNDPRFSWIPQSSEIPVRDIPGLILERKSRLENAPPIRFGLLGRLTVEKGSAAMVEFIEKGKVPCQVHVAGSGPYAETFRALAKRADPVVEVVFHGAYDPSCRESFLRRFFAGIDHLLVPSQDAWETLSMATLEALQHGVPATLCRTGGLISFQHRELGPAPDNVVRLVDPENLDTILTRLAGQKRSDPDQGVEACRDYYERFFSDHCVSQRWTEITNGEP